MNLTTEWHPNRKLQTLSEQDGKFYLRYMGRTNTGGYVWEEPVVSEDSEKAVFSHVAKFLEILMIRESDVSEDSRELAKRICELCRHGGGV